MPQESNNNESRVTAEFVEKLQDLFIEHRSKLLTEDEYVSRKKLLIQSLLDKEPQDPQKFFAALIPSIERGYISAEEVSQISNSLAQRFERR